jgi:hypothetical protein
MDRGDSGSSCSGFSECCTIDGVEVTRDFGPVVAGAIGWRWAGSGGGTSRGSRRERCGSGIDIA